MDDKEFNLIKAIVEHSEKKGQNLSGADVISILATTTSGTLETKKVYENLHAIKQMGFINANFSLEGPTVVDAQNISPTTKATELLEKRKLNFKNLLKIWKVVISIAVFSVIFWTVVTKQVDIQATVSNWFNKKTDFLAVRKPDKIYQNGNEVGTVFGKVIMDKDRVGFEVIHNTAGLNRNQPFEFRREKLKILSFAENIAFEIVSTEKGTENWSGVIKKVICQKV